MRASQRSQSASQPQAWHRSAGVGDDVRDLQAFAAMKIPSVLVGTGKGRRVRQELDRLERSRLDYRQYEMAASVVVRTLQGSGTTAPRSYYRPSRTRRTR